MASPFSDQCVPLDVFFRKICCHMTLQDMGRMTCVSKVWLLCMITDAAWSTIKARVLSQCPEWDKGVFAHYPWKASGETNVKDPKRAKLKQGKKKALLMPSGGTRYVMRRFIVPLMTLKGARSLCILPNDYEDGSWKNVKKYVVQNELFVPLFRLIFSQQDCNDIVETKCYYPRGTFYVSCCFIYPNGYRFHMNLHTDIQTEHGKYKHEELAMKLKQLINGQYSR